VSIHLASSPNPQSPPMQEALYITVKQASEIIGVTEQQVLQHIEDGELPTIRVSNAVRIDLADLRHFARFGYMLAEARAHEIWIDSEAAKCQRVVY
jgi:excisionase family DNA binding protein